MTFEQIMTKQQEILRSVFDEDDLEVTKDTNADDVDEWDSLTHIQLISEIESAFGVKFALGELQTLKNIGDMANLILTKIS